MVGDTFGKLLRAARKQAGFHTIAAFADAIGHWENDRRKPYSSDMDRPKVMQIFQLLVEKGGIDDTTQIDAMLAALARPTLSDADGGFVNWHSFMQQSSRNHVFGCQCGKLG